MFVFSWHKKSPYGSFFYSTIGDSFFHCPFFTDLCTDTGKRFSYYPIEEYEIQLEISENGGPFTPTDKYKCYISGTNTQIQPNNLSYTIKTDQTIEFRDIPLYVDNPSETTVPNRIRVVEVLNNASWDYVKTTIDGTDISKTEDNRIISADKQVMLSENLQYNIVNYYQSTPLTIRKQIDGMEFLVSDEQEFKFIFAFDDRDNGVLPENVNAIKNNSIALSLPSSGGMIEFTLKRGETLTLERVPIGAVFKLLEKKPDSSELTNETARFDAPKFTLDVDDKNISEANIAFSEYFKDTILDGENTITVTNIVYNDGVVLPDTGGVGILSYALCGLTLITVAIVYGIKLRRRSERRHAM